MKMNLLRTLAVFLVLSLSLPIRAELPFPKEKPESEKPLNQHEECLIAELEKILEETVDEALNSQYAELNAAFERESKKLFESRSFWRKAALTEGVLILGTAVSGIMIYSICK